MHKYLEINELKIETIFTLHYNETGSFDIFMKNCIVYIFNAFISIRVFSKGNLFTLYLAIKIQTLILYI